MIILNYCNSGICYSDFNIKYEVENYIKEHSINSNNILEYKVSTENIITEMCLAVYEGKLSPNQLHVIINDISYSVDNNGILEKLLLH